MCLPDHSSENKGPAASAPVCSVHGCPPHSYHRPAVEARGGPHPGLGGQNGPSVLRAGPGGPEPPSCRRSLCPSVSPLVSVSLSVSPLVSVSLLVSLALSLCLSVSLLITVSLLVSLTLSLSVCPGLGPCPSQGSGSPGVGVQLLAWPCKQVPGWKPLSVASWTLHSAVIYQASNLGGHACCLCSGLCRWRWTGEMGLGQGLPHGRQCSPPA